MIEFTAILENFHTRLWSYHIKIPTAIAIEFLNNEHKRVIVTINGAGGYHMGIMPAGDDIYFLNMNAEIRKTLRLNPSNQKRYMVQLQLADLIRKTKGNKRKGYLYEYRM